MNRLYWPATAIFCAVLTFSGVMHAIRIDWMLESMSALGYPPYFMTILGTAKLLGVAALLAPGRPLLKEWAYAGFAFNLLGATATHLSVADPLSEYAGPLVLLAIASASYLTRPASRRMPGAPSLVAQPTA
jgi:hypothetical protein